MRAREGAEPDIGIRGRVEGTDGMSRGTIGWPSYPARTPSTLRFTTKRQSGYWFEPRWSMQPVVASDRRSCMRTTGRPAWRRFI